VLAANRMTRLVPFLRFLMQEGFVGFLAARAGMGSYDARALGAD
jgi:hypothetical protein